MITGVELKESLDGINSKKINHDAKVAVMLQVQEFDAVIVDAEAKIRAMGVMWSDPPCSPREYVLKLGFGELSMSWARKSE